ncbi:hypothetical protein J5N97_022262 [Dioscorea zingiberensis]|uniref:C2H2-type domain-containing protein n=1 Tax=Dioscorea zingiberensis TaxID=325984 RepID=A0A9D5CBL4_9LILI|nr:hypothetical protein J5N97_022262 [Dioscorea zingiberensis]
MEGADLYSLMLQGNGRQNLNPNRTQPHSNLHVNNYGLPLFRSTMPNPMNFINSPPSQIIFLSVPADATIIVTRRSQQYSSSSPFYSIDNHRLNDHLGLNRSLMVAHRVLPSSLRQPPLPLSAPSGHDHYNSSARRRNMHRLIDLNKAPINTNSEADAHGDNTTTTRKYKCQKCMIEFPSPQAYGGHMSFHSKQNKAQFEVGESSRPWKKTRTDGV